MPLQESERDALRASRQHYIELAKRRFIENIELRAERDRYREALERIASYAYGASGVTGDDAGHLTEVGMTAREALDG